MSSLRSLSGGFVQRTPAISIVQVGTKAPVDYSRLEIAVRRADQEELAALPAVAAQALVLVLLHHTQQLGLQRLAQLADFVEEQRASIRQPECTVAQAVCAREGAALVAKNSLPDNSGDTVVQSSTTNSRTVSRRTAVQLPFPVSQSTIATSSSPSRAGLPMTSISVILPFAIVKRSALTNRPCGATMTPMAPSTSAGCVSRARCP